MNRSRIAIYTLVALLALILAYLFLVREPYPDWPMNLIHLLFRH